MDRALSHLIKMREQQEGLRVFSLGGIWPRERKEARERCLGIENSIYILIIESEIEINEQ